MSDSIPPVATGAPAPSTPPPPRKQIGRRIFKIVVLVVVLLIVIVAIGIYFRLNAIVKTVVVNQSSNSLNVPTSLGSADVSIFGGNVKLNQFAIGSPPGFTAPQLMSLGALDVGVNLTGLRDRPLHVRTIAISDPKMVIEMKGTSLNIKKLIDNMPAGDSDPEPADNSKPMKLVIDDLSISNAQVVLRPDLQGLTSIPGLSKTLNKIKDEYTLDVGSIDLKNIGNGDGNNNGAAIKQIVSLIIQQLAAKASQSDQLPPELKQVLSLDVNDLAGSIESKLGQAAMQKLSPQAAQALGGILQNPHAAATNPTNAIEQGLGNLLNEKTSGQKKKKK